MDNKERESEGVMEGYVTVQDGRKWIKQWYMLTRDLALYKFRAHEVLSYKGYFNCHPYYLS